jgi:hypothetical protein
VTKNIAIEVTLSDLTDEETVEFNLLLENPKYSCPDLIRWLTERLVYVGLTALTRYRNKHLSSKQIEIKISSSKGSTIDLYLETATEFNRQTVKDLLTSSLRHGEVARQSKAYGLTVSEQAVRKHRNKMASETVMEKVVLNEAQPDSTLKQPKKWPVGKYVLVSAQNNSPINSIFLQILLNYCEQQQAQLLALPIRYKNVSAWSKDKNVEWDPALTPYYLNDNVNLTAQLTVNGKSRIQSTASDPLSAWVTDNTSAIYGHANVALRTVPTPLGQNPLMLFTTGSITEANFSNTKTGEIAEFNHSLSALIITTYKNGSFDFEHTHLKDGELYTTDGIFTSDSMRPVEVDDIVLGDLHCSEASPETKQDAVNLINRFKPQRVWVHDALSFQEESHHLNRIEKARLTSPSLQTELEELCEELVKYDAEVWLVDSNHGRHIDRWVNSGVISNVRNSLLYHKIWVSILENPSKSPFECALNVVSGKWFNVPPRTGYRSHDIELALPGDIGASGSRGSVRGFANMSNKTITGHGHAAAIIKGAYRTGTMGGISPGYAKGYNSMMLCHALVYANGTRTLLSRTGIK